MCAQQCSYKFLLFFFSVFFYQRKGTRIVLWTEEQEQELEMLYEEFKDSGGNCQTPYNCCIVFKRKMEQQCPRRHLMVYLLYFTDILGSILKKITAKRSRARVVDKLLSMGLVSERQELYKKKRRGSHGKSTGKGMVRFC